MREEDTDTYPNHTFEDGVVIEENSGGGPGYLVYGRTDDDTHFSVDRVKFQRNGMIPYGKLVLFGEVNVGIVAEKGDVFATVELRDGRSVGHDLQHTLGFERQSPDTRNVYVFETEDGREIELGPGDTVSTLQNRL